MRNKFMETITAKPYMIIDSSNPDRPFLGIFNDGEKIDYDSPKNYSFNQLLSKYWNQSYCTFAANKGEAILNMTHMNMVYPSFSLSIINVMDEYDNFTFTYTDSMLDYESPFRGLKYYKRIMDISTFNHYDISYNDFINTIYDAVQVEVFYHQIYVIKFDDSISRIFKAIS